MVSAIKSSMSGENHRASDTKPKAEAIILSHNPDAIIVVPESIDDLRVIGKALRDPSNSTKEFPGTKILATWVHDEGYVHTSAKQVKSLDDFKGLKMRAPTRQTNKLLAKLGATPVGMPVTGVADALSKGTIDGFALPWEVIPAFK